MDSGHEKTLNVTKHQGNASQNHSEIPSHTCENGCHQRQEASVGEAVDANVNYVMQPLWKTVCNFLKKLKIELPDDPELPLSGIYPKEMKSLSQRDTFPAPRVHCVICNRQHTKQPECPSTDEWIEKSYVYEYYLSIKK